MLRLTADRPVRVLHVVGAMNRGGVETWLMHVLRNIDPDRFRFCFLVHSNEPGAYDDEVRSLGGEIVHCPWTRRPIRYAREFRRLVREHGPFDILHSHVHHYSGYLAKLAHQVNIPVRIVHSHTDTSTTDAAASAVRKAYLSFTEHLVRRHATVKLAVSAKAAPALFGRRAVETGACRILHYGIDLGPFGRPDDPSHLRAELGIPENALVIGHVGNLHPVKNHKLLIEIVARMRASGSSTRLLLIGEGPLRAALERQARALGCADTIIFAGARADVPRLLTEAIDLFVFPSLWEGLPVAVIEAQAAGVPLVLSSAVSPEVAILPDLVTWQNPAAGVDAWIEAIETALRRPRVGRTDALNRVAASTFNIESCVRALSGTYAAGQ